MSLTTVLQLCAGVYLVVIVAEYVLRRRLTHFLWELGLGLAVGGLAVALILTSRTPVAFGELSSLHVLGVMFAGTVCGVVAHAVFYLESGRFAWLDVLKPLAITPIVLMPLLGSLPWHATLTTMQLVSFTLLAFQNGFFWQKVLEGAKPTVPQATPSAVRPGA
jgi:hypothetical protein